MVNSKNPNKCRKFWKIKIGDINNNLLRLIILVLVIFTMVYFVTNLFDVFEEKSQKNICKQAIRAEAMTQFRGKDFSIFDKGGGNEVPCPTFYEEITTDDEELIKRQFARHMYDAWDMFHEGRLELFNARGQETFCVLTHHIQFDGSASSVGEIDGFLDYLAENKIPRQRLDNVSYIEYLGCYNTNIDEVNLDRLSGHESIINTEQDYGIMFVYSKKGYVHKVWSALDGAKIGGVVGAVGAALLIFPEPTITKAVGGALLVLGGSAGGGAVGYELGSDVSSDWSACLVLFPYTEEMLSELECDYMPGSQETR